MLYKKSAAAFSTIASSGEKVIILLLLPNQYFDDMRMMTQHFGEFYFIFTACRVYLPLPKIIVRDDFAR